MRMGVITKNTKMVSITDASLDFRKKQTLYNLMDGLNGFLGPRNI